MEPNSRRAALSDSWTDVVGGACREEFLDGHQVTHPDGRRCSKRVHRGPDRGDYSGAQLEHSIRSINLDCHLCRHLCRPIPDREVELRLLLE